jgi:hypothetical protein
MDIDFNIAVRTKHMKMKNKFIYTSLIAFLGISCFVSCKKTEHYGPARQFMPAGVISSESGETFVKLTWKPAVNTDTANTSYRVIVSKDSLFGTGAEHTFTTDTSGITLYNTALLVRQDYFARVKTLGPDSTLDSKWLHSNRFQILGEQIFLNILSADILDNAVVLKWEPTTGLTKIVLTPAAGSPIEITLGAADITAAQRLINGLTASTVYTAEIFQNTISKGITSFRTKDAVTGAIIDLRSIINRPTVLADTIPFIADGSTVILKKGVTYTIPVTINLNKAITIVSEYDFSPALPVIDMTGYFNIVAGSNIAVIAFRDVFLKGNSYSGGYIFNVNNACTITKMSFEGCRVRMVRGMVRLQTAVINVPDFIVDNCVIDSVGNYGVVNVDNVNCKIDNILLSKSTIYKTEKIISSKQNSVSCVIENCTFNETPLTGNYMIDYSTAGTNNVTNGIAVRNSILGIGKTNGTSTAVRGLRANTGTIISSSGNFSLADYVSQSNPIPGVIAHSVPSTAFFQDPANGNFKIIDVSFPAAATTGDPRWRP